jgi:hypothetical protein
MSFIPPNNSAPPTPTSAKGIRAAGGPFSGMFRKSGRKARRALRDGSIGGGGDGHRNVPIEGGVTDSSDSTAPVAENCSARSQFITPRAGNVFVEPSRSFYFSPLNSWHDHGQQNNRNHDVGNAYSHQQLQIGMDTLITVDVERMLRQIVIYCAIFIAGTITSDHASVAYHLLELSLVAWGTSLFIMIMEKRRIVQNTAPPERFLGSNDMELKPTPTFEHDLKGYFDEELPSIRRKRSRHENIDIEPDHDVKQTPSKVEPEVAVEPVVSSSTAIKQQNPHLEHLYVMMVGKQERIIPNCTTYDIDTDLFSGKMLLMFRTPDVDEPSKTDDPIVNYFRGKQRRFEFQWQLRLKKLPPGDLFLGVEVDEPIQMGMIQRALANTALKFTKKMNQVGRIQLHFFLGLGNHCFVVLL